MLVGIGIALLLERFRPPLRPVGLGLGGAMAINLCGAVVLTAWLLTGKLALTALGQIVLWALVVLLVGLSAFEIFS